MDAQHTSAPWVVDTVDRTCPAIRADSVGNGYFGTIAIAIQRDPHPIYGGGISDATAKANAAFIVRACNAHADLLEALRMCAHFIENVSESTPDRTERFFACRESWRRAIARAEGRTP